MPPEEKFRIHISCVKEHWSQPAETQLFFDQSTTHNGSNSPGATFCTNQTISGGKKIAGSKLATRGQVGEAYYIFDINPRMFIKLAGLYYDFEYSNSGSPVGKPQKVDDVKDGDAYSLMPVIDTAYDLNASLTVKF